MPEQLRAAVGRLLADAAMHERRLAATSAPLQAHGGTERAAERIVAVATDAEG